MQATRGQQVQLNYVTHQFCPRYHTTQAYFRARLCSCPELALFVNLSHITPTTTYMYALSETAHWDIFGHSKLVSLI